MTYPGDTGEIRPTVQTVYVPFQYTPLGRRTSPQRFERDVALSRKIFDRMRSGDPGDTSIHLGSPLANRVVEWLVADLFGCRGFQPQGRKIKVPFYLTYRGPDHAVSSCFGGLHNPPGRRGKRSPGIYYLDPAGKWVHCPWTRDTDAGIVITIYDPGTEAMELVIFGYSAVGTQATGRLILDDAGPFWPAYVESKGKRIGVWVCRFNNVEDSLQDKGNLRRAANSEVIPIDGKVLLKYLA